MTIYYIAPDNPKPCGGIKTRYRHVDILNRNNIPAFVLHEQPGFRCDWFTHDTPVTSFSELSKAYPSDILVLTEVHGPQAHTMAEGLLKKVIFNQGIFNTFNGYSSKVMDTETPYLSQEVLAVIVNSEYAFEYINHTFPRKPLFRIHYGINPDVFYPRQSKKRQICYFPSKNIRDVLQVFNILKFRNVLDDWDVIPIENKSESEVAAIMGESMVYFNFTPHEGFGMPAVEALASGCIVVGYDGVSGYEYMRPNFSFPVTHGNVLEFAKTAERVLHLFGDTPDRMLQRGQAAAEFVQKLYYPAREERELVSTWENILQILEKN